MTLTKETKVRIYRLQSVAERLNCTVAPIGEDKFIIHYKGTHLLTGNFAESVFFFHGLNAVKDNPNMFNKGE